MAQKYTFIVEVGKDNKPIAHAWVRSEAALAVQSFNAMREAGIEAYLFQFPVADKKSKSASQHAATSAATAQPSVEEAANSKRLAAEEAAHAAAEVERLAQERAIKTFNGNQIGGF